MNPSDYYIMPINIFFQLSGLFIEDAPSITINPSASNVITRIKKLRFFVEPDGLSRPFEFEIIFRINRLRDYNIENQLLLYTQQNLK